jgi:membrane protein implicated in regulation of membrane protease activity
MAGWVIWIIAASVLAVGEMLTLGFFLAPFRDRRRAGGAGGRARRETPVAFVVSSSSSRRCCDRRPDRASHPALPPATRTGRRH